MASPLSLHIVPNCGLIIETADSVLNRANHDETEPIKYEIINKGNFNLRHDYEAPQSGDIFSGWLSPASEVSLPPIIKERAGVPLEARHYAFMHPPMGLAAAIDWNNPLNSSDNFRDHYFQPGRGEDLLRLSITKILTVNEKAMADASYLGGFVYFDKHFNVLCVNAISLQSDGSSFLNLSGPFSTTDAVGPSLRQKNRVHALTLDIFHEGGLSACSWVRPDEIFEDKPLSLDRENMSGALVFFRDDMSSYAYMVDNSDTSYPKGQVEILPEIIQSLPSNFLRNDEVTFIFKFLNRDENEKWCQEALQIIEFDHDDWEDDLRCTLYDPKTLLHKACLNRFDHLIISELLKNRSEQRNLSYPDKLGWLPLHFACRYYQNIEVIKLLLYYYPEAILHQDPFGRYPLHIACLNRDSSAEVIELLLQGEGGKIVYKRTKRMNMTPLYIACDSKADAGVIRLLLDADPHGDTIQLKSTIGRLPLHLAIDEKMDPEIIEMLLIKDEELKGKKENYIPDILQVRGGFLVRPSLYLSRSIPWLF